MLKKTAIAHFGGVSKTARALGITPEAVTRWGEEIPQGRAYQIESLTGGLLKAVSENQTQQEAKP